jgi:hypothetical protein
MNIANKICWSYLSYILRQCGSTCSTRNISGSTLLVTKYTKLFINVTSFFSLSEGGGGSSTQAWMPTYVCIHSPDDMSLESDGGIILTGENRRTRRKTCPSATLSTTNSTWIDPDANHVTSYCKHILVVFNVFFFYSEGFWKNNRWFLHHLLPYAHTRATYATLRNYRILLRIKTVSHSPQAVAREI